MHLLSYDFKDKAQKGTRKPAEFEMRKRVAGKNLVEHTT
jgi:hypothetical protein